MKAIKSETINSYWRKICPDDFIGFKTKAVKKIMKETVCMVAGGGEQRISSGASDRKLEEWSPVLGK